jgi:hypothetical protein
MTAFICSHFIFMCKFIINVYIINYMKLLIEYIVKSVDKKKK